MASKFLFLQANYPELFTISELAEKLYYVDPSSSLAKARLFSEKLAVLIWQFENLDAFSGTQVDRINQLFYKNAIPEIVKDLFHAIRKSGNKASHDGTGNKQEALFVLKKSFQLAKWFYETYEMDYLGAVEYVIPADDTQTSVDALQLELEKLSKQVTDYESKIAAMNATPELITERQSRAAKNANNISKSEAETRELIDEKLREAGWECDTQSINYKTKTTVPQKGRNMAIAEWPCDGKWADYALFVGTTLYGIVEAKKYAADISTDLRQSKIYASCITLSVAVMLTRCRFCFQPTEGLIWSKSRPKAGSGFSM